MSSDVYKERLTTIRNQQKQMIKQDIAASGNTDWTVNNNKAKGRKMVNDMKKLLLRAFNSECDETIGKVKYNNIETSVRKIVKSADIKAYEAAIRNRIAPFTDFPIIFTSALTKQRIFKVMETALHVYENKRGFLYANKKCRYDRGRCNRRSICIFST